MSNEERRGGILLNHDRRRKATTSAVEWVLPELTSRAFSAHSAQATTDVHDSKHAAIVIAERRRYYTRTPQQTRSLADTKSVLSQPSKTCTDDDRVTWLQFLRQPCAARLIACILQSALHDPRTLSHQDDIARTGLSYEDEKCAGFNSNNPL